MTNQLIFREATITDISQILDVRFSVKENRLSNPEFVQESNCVEYLTTRGKGWVCEMKDQVVGFAIVDLIESNIWALFIRREFEKNGIGKKLHDIMMDWYFSQTKSKVWLGTSPHTRAETFYRKCGWIEVGKHGTDEIKFEMSHDQWIRVGKA